MKELKVDSVELEFNGRQLFKSVYLSCRQGEVIGLLGGNGCGKSTLLKVIFGSQRANHKYVSIDAKFVSKGYQYNRIAYLPQHNYLPNGVPVCKLARLIVDPLLWHEFSKTAIYLECQHKTRSQLSGGQLRQIETIMILFSKADFILLDEPFTHISPIQAEELKALIKYCARTKGFIITDHQYENIIDVSDRLILLHNGETKHIAARDELAKYGYISGI